MYVSANLTCGVPPFWDLFNSLLHASFRRYSIICQFCFVSRYADDIELYIQDCLKQMSQHNMKKHKHY